MSSKLQIFSIFTGSKTADSGLSLLEDSHGHHKVTPCIPGIVSSSPGAPIRCIDTAGLFPIQVSETKTFSTPPQSYFRMILYTVSASEH